MVEVAAIALGSLDEVRRRLACAPKRRTLVHVAFFVWSRTSKFDRRNR
jgi:hypothetical protein